MRKFPVVSGNGTEYLVTISEHHYFLDHYKVKVYLPYVTKILKRNKFKCVSEHDYIGEKWKYDFVRMAKREVSDYEEDEQKKLDREKSLKEHTAAFDSWDGKI